MEQYEESTVQSMVWMGEVVQEVNEDEITKYSCNCMSEDEVWMVDNWEKFWDTPAGQDTTFWTSKEEKTEDKPKKTIAEIVRKIRKLEWVKKYKKEEVEDINKTWEPHEVLAEDIQDYGRSMVVIGSDIIS